MTETTYYLGMVAVMEKCCMVDEKT
jgi:hypothetical protein